MLHPSYTELMEKINKEGEQGEEPVINSRYSIVTVSYTHLDVYKRQYMNSTVILCCINQQE